MNKERSFDIKLGVTIFTIIILLSGYFYVSNNIKQSRYKFYAKESKSESISIAEIHSADYYELDWLLCMAMTKAESRFKIMAKSTYWRKGRKHHAYGLKQLVMSTAGYCRDSFDDRFKDSSIYEVDFNVWSGNLHFKNVLENYAKGDILVAIEMYNVGTGAYRRGTKEGVNRNSRHVKKVTIYYQQLKEKWNKFKKW
jgi:soluble lytic murein transglycosylase-like protein